MKVNPITNRIFPIKFKANPSEDKEYGRLGYGDPEIESNLDFLREHVYDSALRDQNKQGLYLSTENMNALLNSMLNSGDNTSLITNQKLLGHGLRNLKKLPYTRNSYSGHFDVNKYNVLEEAGIKRVIGIEVPVGSDEDLKSYGLEGLTVDFYDALNPEKGLIFLDEEERQVIAQNNALKTCYQEEWDKLEKAFEKELNTFVKFIQMMQKDNLYIGCRWGANRTAQVLDMNRIFNPKAGNNYDRKDYLSRMKLRERQNFLNLYNNLSQENKEAMCWSPEFDKELGELLRRF